MPIFQDHFLDNDNEWELRDDAQALLQISPGDYAYLFSGRSKEGCWTTWQPLFFEHGLEYKIHAVIELVVGEDKEYGLLWGCEDEHNCYSFELRDRGSYRIRKRVAANWIDVQPWTHCSEMRVGENAVNELLIKQLATKTKFYINEFLVMTLPVLEPLLGQGFGFMLSGRQTIRIHSSIVLRHVEWEEFSEVKKGQVEEVQPTLDELQHLIGMDNIKQEIKTFINFLKVQKLRQERGLIAPSLSLHMVLAGPPGTGKTTIARLLGKLYKNLGLLPQGHLVETDRAGLVAPYVGQTALKVNQMVEKAMGGVLFIDEAYSLMPKQGGGHDFGQEAIEVLLKRMEDHRDKFALIIAGYGDELHRFLDSNPGVKSRFNRYFYFEHYKPDELSAIFVTMADEMGLFVTDEARLALLQIFMDVCEKRNNSFGNGRFVRNLLEKSLERQANRIVDFVNLTDRELSTLSDEDICF